MNWRKNAMKPETIAENGDRCFVCAQSTLTRDAVDRILLKGKELYCRFCGAIHASYVDFDGFQKIVVKGIKHDALSH
jgi:hypothetical protein